MKKSFVCIVFRAHDWCAAKVKGCSEQQRNTGRILKLGQKSGELRLL